MLANVIDWIDYAALRGRTVVNDSLSEQALVRAYDYLYSRYILRYNLDEEDPKVIKATYIAAGYELDEPNFWSSTYSIEDMRVLTGLGSELKWTVAETHGPDSFAPTSTEIENLLTPLRNSALVMMVV